ncbi:MAG: hypothetical protein AAF394_11550 [Planctomycetota bacterium]
MTQQSRWPSVLLAILAVNIAAVLVTSAWRFASAQEPTAVEKESAADSGKEEEENEQEEDADQATPEVPQVDEAEQIQLNAASKAEKDPTKEVAERLANLEIPEGDLPEAPADPQLMQSILAEAGISPEYLQDPPSISARPQPKRSIHDIARRLETVQQLTESALSLLGEAESAQLAGDPAEAERFLQMSLRIKEMAAELLRSQ